MKVRNILISTLLLILLSQLAFGAFKDREEGKFNKPGGNQPPPPKLIEYNYKGEDGKSSFIISIPNGWMTVEKEKGEVYFSPPQIKMYSIGVFVENNPEINSPDKYKELSKSILNRFKQKELIEEAQPVQMGDMTKWVTVWKIQDYKPENSKEIKKENKEGILINIVYFKDGVTFSLAGGTSVKHVDSFKQLFYSVSETFKPGEPPAIAVVTSTPGPVNTQTPVVSNTQTPVASNTPSPVAVNTPNNQGTDSRGTSPPSIFILEPSDLVEARNLNIEYEGSVVHIAGIADDADGIAQVLINGKEAVLSQANKGEMSKPVEFKQDILLALGENTVKIEAVDINNNRTISTYKINRIPDVQESTVKGEQWAVVIGVSKFKDTRINTLKYTVNDAKGIYEYLTTKAGFKEDHIKLLLDDQATTVNIRDALGVFLSKKALKEDMVFIYFAGHGAPEPDPMSTDKDGLTKYMIAYDTNLDSLYSTAIRMDEIATIFGRLSAKQVVFFIDSCYSGASGGRTFSTSDGRAVNVSDGFLADLSGKGRVVVTASDSNEISLEKEQLKHGIFTYYLLEGLNGAADTDKDGKITLDEVYNYTDINVRRASENRQHPVKKGETSGSIVLGVKENK